MVDPLHHSNAAHLFFFPSYLVCDKCGICFASFHLLYKSLVMDTAAVLQPFVNDNLKLDIENTGIMRNTIWPSF